MIREMALLLIMASLVALVDAEGNGFSLDFHAESTGGDENSMTTYSYLKEPRVSETDYTRGLKSGSFNYFNNSKNIIFDESMHLAYGNATNISNSTLSHYLEVEFDGGEDGNGISEFYGAGLFPNNRGLSAWKKIRYEKSKWLTTKDGASIRDFNANKINVSASVDMTTGETSEYSFSFVADAKDSVIQTKDATGWSNRTGSRRLDSEHEALMTGNFAITNTLREIMPPAGEPFGDWLPCCFNSTMPTLKQPENPWPSNIVIKTLQEYNWEPKSKLSCADSLPDTTECGEWKFNNATKDWEKVCKLKISPEDKIGEEKCGEWTLNESTKDWEKICKLQPCTDGFVDCPTGGCPGFECIKTFNQPEYDYYPETMTIADQKKLNDIQLTYSYSDNKDLFSEIPAEKSNVDFDGDGNKDKASQVVYELLLVNIGRTTLRNLSLMGTLPERAVVNLSFEGKLNEEGDGFAEKIYPDWDSSKRYFTLKLGSLNVRERRQFYLNVLIDDTSKSNQVAFSVVGNSLDGSEIKDIATWQPADIASLETWFLRGIEMLNNSRPKLPGKREETYEPQINHGIYRLDNTTIYSVEIDNSNQKSLKNANMNVTADNIAAEFLLSYEVDLENKQVRDVIESKEINRFSWNEIQPNEVKFINIWINNSTSIDLENFILELNAERTDGSIYKLNSSNDENSGKIFQDMDIGVIEDAYKKAKEKFR